MKKKIVFYSLFAVLVLAYLLTVFILQPDSTTMARYKLNTDQLRLVSLTIIVPICVLWFAAVYGMVQIGRYIERIGKSSETEGFTYLGFGVAVLGFGQPINSLISRLLAYLNAQGDISMATMTIINTHLSILPPLISFILIFIGAWKLLGTIKNAIIPAKEYMSVGLGLAVLSVVYVSAVLLNPARNAPTETYAHSAFYMPDWLIMATIVIPLVLVWGVGFYATLLLRAYYLNVGGKIYKQALARLNLGFFVVIISYIMLQFTTAASHILIQIGLNGILAFVYLLLLVIAVGYINIARGAKGLSKLEEVT